MPLLRIVLRQGTDGGLRINISNSKLRLNLNITRFSLIFYPHPTGKAFHNLDLVKKDFIFALLSLLPVEMKQYEAVIETLERLGGIATLGELNREVFKIKDCEWKTKTPFASIRRIVQVTDGIYKIKPGLYGLEKYRKQNECRGIFSETDTHKDIDENNKFTHTYYQGLLLIIGRLHGLNTFVPCQDKNKKFYDGRSLAEMSTLSALPKFSYQELVNRSSTIDTIWFNERNMPHSFFEVEHSTDIQNSLLKFNDLQDFYVRMVIVADEKRRDDYKHKLGYHAFDELCKRVSFLSYDALGKQYEYEIEKQKIDFIL